MRTCEYCRQPVAATTAKCPHCLGWSEAVLVQLLQRPEPSIRAQAGFDTVFAQRTERLIRALAVALRDPVTAVRQQAGVGSKSEFAAAMTGLRLPPALTTLNAFGHLIDGRSEQHHGLTVYAGRSTPTEKDTRRCPGIGRKGFTPAVSAVASRSR